MTVSTRLPVRIARLARVGLHLVQGLTTAAARFPSLERGRRAECVRRWSAALLEILAVRVEVSGTPPPPGARGLMIVSNHISWLDVYAINAVQAARFVAKAEVRKWPAIGWLSARAGTLFIERASRHHSVRVNRDMENVLADGEIIAVFPEGTTTDGRQVLPFHAALLQPAVDRGGWLHPLAIRYRRVDGSPCSEVVYDGDKTVIDTLVSMTAQPEIRAELYFLPPVSCAGRHRRELAQETAGRIAATIGVPAPNIPRDGGLVTRKHRTRPGAVACVDPDSITCQEIINES
jgi:1-acyl-sn-glycerol-3-phosphate acyltransferase